MHKETKTTAISKRVKEVVWRRDMERCVICGVSNAGPHCHFIRRSQGGMGMEENVWTGCQKCHEAFDSEGTDGPLHMAVEDHLKAIYPGWCKGMLIYKKYREEEKC